MRLTSVTFRRWIAVLVIGACTAPAFAQGPGGAPGMPMQRLGPSRGPATGMGTPGAPMARLGRSGGGFSAAAPARRSYSGMAGVGGVMSSQNFRASNIASQARGGGVQRSAAGMVSGATRGIVGSPANPR